MESSQSDLETLIKNNFTKEWNYLWPTLQGNGLTTIDDVKQLSPEQWTAKSKNLASTVVDFLQQTVRPTEMTKARSTFERNANLIMQRTKESKLWEHQKQALENIYQASMNKNYEKRCIILPTGTGKTAIIILAPFFVAAGGQNVRRVMILAPNKKVATQTEDSATKNGGIFIERNILSETEFYNLQLTVGTGKPSKDKLSNPICIFNPEKFYKSDRLKNGEIPDWMKLPDDSFDLVIIDEVHRYPAGFWLSVEKKFGDHARIIFLTATPYRGDKKDVITEEQQLFYLSKEDCGEEENHP